MGPNTERNRRKRERQQAALEALEAETQAANEALAPYDRDVEEAKKEMHDTFGRLYRAEHHDDYATHATTAVEKYMDAKIRRAAFKLGLNPDELW